MKIDMLVHIGIKKMIKRVEYTMSTSVAITTIVVTLIQNLYTRWYNKY